jgi:hypothetical protein
MKKSILKFAKVAVATSLLFVTSTIVNAQGNPGGNLNGTDGAASDSSPAVPLDSNMTLLFVAITLLFVTYKFKKGQLSILSK